MQSTESNPPLPGRVAELLNQQAAGDLLLVCEHASNVIPPVFGGLGLDEETRRSHIAWDPGALPVAEAMSAALDAPLVVSRVSRLVYDCNRPPEAAAAIPEKSEIYDIPGNVGLSPSERATRVSAFYRPFEALMEETIRILKPTAMITVHSFTPVWFGQPRAVEIGILHGRDRRLADIMLDCAGDFTDRVVLRNEPYGPEDGVAHTLDRHGARNRLANVMIEIRNDLVADASGQAEMAAMLSAWVAEAAARLERAGAA